MLTTDTTKYFLDCCENMSKKIMKQTL